jgi:hypothetical protein
VRTSWPPSDLITLYAWCPYSIGIMKIEVTFDPAAKQAFRNECIKRLRGFVEDMKAQQQLWKDQDAPLLAVEEASIGR